MKVLWQQARERLKGSRCRVCPSCDGKVCAGELPGMGGTGTGVSFRNNIAALAAHRFVMRVLHSANEPDPSVDFLGHKLAFPVMAAPVGSVGATINSDLPEVTYANSLFSGCERAGTLAGVGDTSNLERFSNNIKAAGEKARLVVPFIKPWSFEAVSQRMGLIAEAGCTLCGMDVDAVGLTGLRKSAAPVATRTYREIAAYAKRAHDLGLKYIVKGIMAPDEAIIAADAGADAVLVSNHGGRVLDHTPGTAEALPAIADAVGKRVVVMLDGGIRSGADVLKALALGAHMTLICRPVMIAIHGDEENGLATYYAHIREELIQAMRLTGCADVASVTNRILC